MGKKHTEINIIKNPQDQNITFVSDPVKELILSLDQRENNSSTINSDSNEKLVKKARHNSAYSTNKILKKSKQGLSKQNHSPVYE